MEILCPYCCSRFSSKEVHFRLNEPLEEVEEEAADEENIFGTAVGRSKGSKKANKNSGKKLDERLYNYYREYLSDDSAAREAAMQYNYVAFDDMNSEIQFNRQEMNKYGYVNRIRYKNQELKTRLCPNCHKNLVKSAGKYPMYMFSVIGDTEVGKSIYLTVLEAMLGRGAFDTTLLFVGTQEERDYYRGANKKVMQDRMMLQATIGKVPPLTFQFTYSAADENIREKRTILITFCDIPGEMCRNEDTLEIYGAHLKASSGLMFLIDPTRFKRIRHMIAKETKIDNLYQLDVIEAINKFLVSDSYETSSGIPTAIVITKADTLKPIAFFHESEAHQYLIGDQQWNNRHPDFVNEDEIQKINSGVCEFLNAIDEDIYTRSIGNIFSDCSFFINSALGYTPEDEIADKDKDIEEQIRKEMLNPYRITEAFYWILAENSVLPRKMTQVYRNSKTGEEKKISCFYYKNHDQKYVQQKIEARREQCKIKDSFWGGKWEIIRTSYS